MISRVRTTVVFGNALEVESFGANPIGRSLPLAGRLTAGIARIASAAKTPIVSHAFTDAFVVPPETFPSVIIPNVLLLIWFWIGWAEMSVWLRLVWFCTQLRNKLPSPSH